MFECSEQLLFSCVSSKLSICNHPLSLSHYSTVAGVLQGILQGILVHEGGLRLGQVRVRHERILGEPATAGLTGRPDCSGRQRKGQPDVLNLHRDQAGRSPLIFVRVLSVVAAARNNVFTKVVGGWVFLVQSSSSRYRPSPW